MLEAVTTTADGLQEVIEEMDASNEVILRVHLTPISRGRYVCAAFPEELSHLAEEGQLPRKILLQHALQHTSADISYHSGECFNIAVIMCP